MCRASLLICAVGWIAILSFLALFGFVKIIVAVINNNKLPSETPIELYTYLSRRINPQTHQNSVEYVTLSEFFHSDDFRHFKDENSGTHTLITNFGSPEFRCEGTCHCSPIRRSAIPSNLLSRGLFTLVSALSVTVALHIAHSSFQEQCVEQFEDECPVDRIISKAETCEEIDSESPQSESTEGESNEDNGLPTYFCYGPCIPRLQELGNRLEDEYGLEIDEIMGSHTHLSRILDALQQRMINICRGLNGKMEVRASSRETAVQKFLLELKQVCKKSSDVYNVNFIRKLFTDVQKDSPGMMEDVGYLCTSPDVDVVLRDIKVEEKTTVWCERKV